MRRSPSIVAVLSVIVLAPYGAHGQTNGAFTGRITDNTGGVLPGATVEAASPALIEGSRITISDEAGRYALADLRPGDYTLTFMLPGFSTVVREGLDLPAGFTMTIDGELSIGGLEETVTVSGTAPVVDVHTNARAEVLDRAILDAIPTGHNLQSTAQLIVGVKLNRPEVGLTTAAQQTFMAVHGMNPSQTTVRVDGQIVNSLNLDGAGQAYHNHLAHQELVYETAGVSAETSGGGVRVNMIPREGGNAFSGQGYLGGSIDRWQADGLESLSPRSVARGVAGTEGIDFLYDLNVGQGGAIVRDALWFFGSFRNMQIDKKVTNSFHRETDVAPRFFDPAPVRLDGRDGRPRVPGIDENTVTNALLRLTYRADAVNKFSAYLDRVFKDRHATHDAFTDVPPRRAGCAEFCTTRRPRNGPRPSTAGCSSRPAIRPLSPRASKPTRTAARRPRPARLPNGARLFGGWTFERNVSTRCDVPHDPNRQLFCDARDYGIPFLHEFKLSGSVPLPGGIQVSGSAQFYPAQEAVAGGGLVWGGTHQGGALEGARPYNGNIDYIVPSSVFADQGQVRTQSFSVPLMPPGALFYDRLTQVDLSVRRTFALANGMRWELQADIYNFIDAQPILNGNNAFGTTGASLGSASSTIQGRFLQVGSHIHR